jgi:hypothetical protein
MLELLVVPQRGMPYDQMGFRIVLYISNLFSSDRFDFLPVIQYMRWSCNPSCFLLVNMCFCHVSLWSRWMPKYLAFSPCGIRCPFKSHNRKFLILTDGNKLVNCMVGVTLATLNQY